MRSRLARGLDGVGGEEVMRRGDAPGTLSQRLDLETPRRWSRGLPAAKAKEHEKEEIWIHPGL